MFRRCFVLPVAFALLLALALPFAVMAADPPQVPHQIEGREYCTMCHKVGGIGVNVVGGVGMPDDHLNRTDNICLSCHKAKAAAAGSATGVLPAGLAASTAPLAATPTAAAPTATAVPTAISAPKSAEIGLTATAGPTAVASTALPSAGEPLEDFARVAPFFVAGLLLLAGAAAVQRALARLP